jgi:hypothetical protein
MEYGRVVDPRLIEGHYAVGPCAKTMDSLDVWVCLQLYLQEPSRTLPSYCKLLYHITGTAVSESTTSRLFLGFFPFRGSLRKPTLTPYDKFKPENIARANEFILFIIKIAPHRLKFGDEKLLKGGDLFNRQVRRNLLTGEVPSVMTSSDFRNTYAVTGFCGIDVRTCSTQPFWID